MTHRKKPIKGGVELDEIHPDQAHPSPSHRTRSTSSSSSSSSTSQTSSSSKRLPRAANLARQAEDLSRSRSSSAIIKENTVESYRASKKKKLTISAAFAFVSPKRLDQMVRHKNIQLNVNAILSIIIMVVELEMAYDHANNTTISTVYTEGMKAVMSVLTLVLLYQIYSYYHFQMLIQASEWKINKKVSLWHEKKLFRAMLTECVICVVHPVPFVVPDWVGVFMFLRLYLIVRLVRDNNITYKLRNELHQHLKEKRSMLLPPKHNWRLTVKGLFAQKSVKSVITLTFLILFATSFAVHILERESNPEFNNFFLVIYYSVVTITSVGYGDVTPKSIPGRALSMIISIAGVFVASLLVAVLAKTLELKRHQHYAVAWVALQHRSRKYRIDSATCIAMAWRWHYMKQQKRRMSPHDVTGTLRMTAACDILHLNLLHALRSHRRVRKLVGLLKLDVTDFTLKAVNSINEKVDHLESQMTQKLTQLDHLNIKLRSVMEQQEEILQLLKGAQRQQQPQQFMQPIPASSSTMVAQQQPQQPLSPEEQQRQWEDYQRKYAEWQKQVAQSGNVQGNLMQNTNQKSAFRREEDDFDAETPPPLPDMPSDDDSIYGSDDDE